VEPVGRVDSDGSVAAVILAAGRASRMGTSKALLPLGAESVLRRVVRSVAEAGIADIIVVTGHEPAMILAELQGLGVRHVHNPGYDAGMFSSVKTGVAAVRPEAEAFFMLPVDYPLVRAQVLQRLLTESRRDGCGLTHPVCCERRGHPPLLAGRYRDELLTAAPHDDLGSFLRARAGDETQVETNDLTILMDMDTAEDYQKVARFAAVLDAAAAADAGAPKAERPATLTREEALYLLALLEVPDQIVRHCQAVADVGHTLALALQPFVAELDAEVVRSAGLLHDMARMGPRHAVVAQELLSNLGLMRLGEVVGAHMVLPPEQMETTRVTEEQLVYLSDKLVVDDRVGTLEERAAATVLRGGEVFAHPDPQEGLRLRMQVARSIQQRVESILGRPLGEVLSR
jgi:molybdenum cofactor cytidylyltransferase